jgi:hypothetical protein
MSFSTDTFDTLIDFVCVMSQFSMLNVSNRETTATLRQFCHCYAYRHEACNFYLADRNLDSSVC